MLAQFVLDCLTVIQEQPLSRAKIRHALSMGAPLGTKSAVIDQWAETVYKTLDLVGLVRCDAGIYTWVADNPGVN